MTHPQQPNCACCTATIMRPYGDLWDGRLDDYCDECATARCDAYPGECPKGSSGSWRVAFTLEEWDEVRYFDVYADSEEDAIEKACIEHPWEADIASNIAAWEIKDA